MKALPLRPALLAALLLASAAAVAPAQNPPPPPKKKGGLIKAVTRLVDTTATAAAAGAVDSLLGTKPGPCPAGTVPASGAAPTVGSEVVATAKRKLIGEPRDSAPVATPAAAPARPACVAPSSANASAAPPPPPPAGKVATAVAAVSAAPVAAKAVGGLFGKKGPDKAGMIKDLARGRLVLKSVRFLPGSDALEKPIDDEVAALAEALASMEAAFVLNMPAEAKGGAPADTAIARRRLDRLIGYLQVAGVTQERVPVVGVFPPGLDPKNRPPGPGDARPELVVAPKNPSPQR